MSWFRRKPQSVAEMRVRLAGQKAQMNEIQRQMKEFISFPRSMAIDAQSLAYNIAVLEEAITQAEAK
jgi:hypothetical protein